MGRGCGCGKGGGQELVFYFSQRVFTSYLLLRFHHRVNIKSDPSPAKQGL